MCVNLTPDLYASSSSARCCEVPVPAEADDSPPVYLSGGAQKPNNGGAYIVASGSTLGRYTVFSLRKQF